MQLRAAFFTASKMCFRCSNSRAIQNARYAAVAAVASRNESRARMFVRETDLTRCCTTYGMYESMFQDESVDAVYVAVPTKFRKDMALKAIQNGKHVLIETPAALNLGDLVEITNLARRLNVQFMTGCAFPHNERTFALARELNDCEFGELQTISTHVSFPGMCTTDFLNHDIRMNAELEPTGVLGFLGWPCICFAIMMFDLQHGYKQRPTEVSCKFHRQIKGVCTTATGDISFEKGGSSTFSVSFDQAFDQRVSIFGTSRSIHVDDFVHPLNGRVSKYQRVDNTLSLRHERVYAVNPQQVRTESSQEACLFETFSTLVLKLRDGSGFLDDGEHSKWTRLALETQCVLDAAYKSAKAGGFPAVINRGCL